MSSAASILREQIRRHGPISFARFMEVALYHPEYGYYSRPRPDGQDPFGKHGDFYTAEQLQPVFGILIAAFTESLHRELASPEPFTVVELGPGRADMQPYFDRWRYIPVDVNRPPIDEPFSGLVFANEFFDALPVHLVAKRESGFHERLVTLQGDEFQWVDGDGIAVEIARHLTQYGAPAEIGDLLEVNLAALDHLRRLTQCLNDGFLLAIDYGYTAREIPHFPQGSLMSYRRHQALDDVLAEPGLRDITAHVNFTALEKYALSLGWETVRMESLASLLLRAGQPDQFAAALGVDAPAARRLQLKTLLYGMGETFRVLLLRKRPA
jgi:SAM-dependent MidA family methyltransferase